MSRRTRHAIAKVACVWPVATAIHALISLTAFVLTGDSWNPLGLTVDRGFAGVVLAVICLFVAGALCDEHLWY